MAYSLPTISEQDAWFAMKRVVAKRPLDGGIDSRSLALGVLQGFHAIEVIDEPTLKKLTSDLEYEASGLDT